MPQNSGLMQGKRAVILGVANNRPGAPDISLSNSLARE
jgi:enoyl-[acyl-carrier-protein] reductase (NADH)